MKKRVLLWVLILALGFSSLAPALALRSRTEKVDMLSRLEDILNLLLEEHYEEFNKDELLLAAIRGMIEATGDPYTYYYTPDEMKSLTEEEEGEYYGIGALLTQGENNAVTVVRVFKNTPAEEAGLRPHDKILKVGDEELSAESSLALSESIEKIKSSTENDPRVLTIERNGEILTMTVIPRTVMNNRTDCRMIGDVGYLALYEFFGDGADGVTEAVSYFKENNATGMILDLRDNPGGLVYYAAQIADLFLPEGVIVTMVDRYGSSQSLYSDAESYDIPMVVLINEGSASASEILSGALRDYGRATLVGTKTYGKGIVQSVLTFKQDGAGIQLTTDIYLTPNGDAIHKKGIEPDIYVELPEDFDRIALYDVDPSVDPQLAAALAALANQ